MEAFTANVTIYNKNSKIPPSQKLVQLMDAIKEEHEEEYKRLALDTIKNKDFNVDDEKVVEKCLILLKKWYDKPKFQNIVNYYRNFQSLKMQPNESIVEFF